MGKIVRKINPYFSFQFDHLENWLEEMARKGFVLKKAGRLIMTFEEEEPYKGQSGSFPERPDGGIVTRGIQKIITN